MTQMVDLQRINVELDAEDQELFALFPKRRECRWNDWVIVKCYRWPWQREDRFRLMTKADIAIRRKRARAALCWAFVAVACVCLAMAIITAVRGSGRPLGWLVGFESITVPAVVRWLRSIL